MKKSNDTIGNRTHDLPAVAQYLNQLGHRVPHQYVRVTVKSRSITFCALSSSFIKHPRQQFKKNFTQRFELRPLQDPGGSGVSKSRINSVVNFWLVWTQAWRSQTVYVWSSWLLCFQIRKRTLLVLGKKTPPTVTSETITEYEGHGVTRGIIFRVTGQNFIDGGDKIVATGISVHVFDISPHVWYLFHPNANSICTSQMEWIQTEVSMRPSVGCNKIMFCRQEWRVK